MNRLSSRTAAILQSAQKEALLAEARSHATRVADEGGNGSQQSVLSTSFTATPTLAQTRAAHATQTVAIGTQAGPPTVEAPASAASTVRELQHAYAKVSHERAAVAEQLAAASLEASKASAEQHAALSAQQARIIQLEQTLSLGPRGDDAAQADLHRQVARERALAQAGEVTLLSSQVADQRRKLEDVTARYEAAMRQCESLQSQVREVEVQAARAHASLASSSQGQVAELQARVRELEQQRAFALADTASCQAELSRVLADREQLKTRLERAQSEALSSGEHGERQVQAVRAELTQSLATSLAKDRELASLQGQVERLSREAREACAALQRGQEDWAREKAGYSQAVRQAEEHVRALEGRAERAEHELGRVRMALGQVETRAGEAEKSVSSLKAQLQECAVSHEKHTALLEQGWADRLRQEVEKARRELLKELSAADSNAAVWKERCSALEGEVQHLREERQGGAEQAARQRQAVAQEHKEALDALRQQYAAEMQAFKSQLQSSYDRRCAEADAAVTSAQGEARQAVHVAQAQAGEADRRAERAVLAAEDYSRRLEGARSELRGAYASLEEHRAALVEERRSRAEETGRVEAEVRRLATALAQQEERAVGAQKQVEQTKADLVAVQLKLEKVHGEHDSLRASLSTSDAQLGAHRTLVGDLRAQCTALERALQADHAARAAEVASLQAQLSEVDSSRKDVLAQLSASKGSAAAEREERAKGQEMIATLKAELDHARKGLQQEETRRLEAESKAASAERSWHEQVERLTSELEEAREGLHAAQTQAVRDAHVIDRLRAEASSRKDENARLFNGLTGCQREIETLKAQLDVSRRAAQSSEQRAGVLGQEREQWVATEARLRQALAQQENKLVQVQNELSSTQRACTSLQSFLEESQGQGEKERMQHRYTQEKMQQLVSTFTSAKDDAQRLVAEAQRDRARCDALQVQHASLVQALEASQSRAQAGEQAAQAALARANATEVQAAGYKQENAAKDAELTRLAGELGRAQAEIGRYRGELSRLTTLCEEGQRAQVKAEGLAQELKAETDRLRDALQSTQQSRERLVVELEGVRSEAGRQKARATAAEQDMTAMHSQQAQGLGGGMNVSILDTTAMSLRSQALPKSPSKRGSIRQASSPARAGRGPAQHTQAADSYANAHAAQMSIVQAELQRVHALRDKAQEEADKLRVQLSHALVQLSRAQEEATRAQAEAEAARAHVQAQVHARAQDTAVRKEDAERALLGSSTAQQAYHAACARLEEVQAELAACRATIHSLHGSLGEAQAARHAAEQRAVETEERALRAESAALQAQQEVEASKSAYASSMAQVESRASAAVARAEAQLDGAVAQAEERVAEAARLWRERVDAANRAAAEAKGVANTREQQLDALTALQVEYGRVVDRVADELHVARAGHSIGAGVQAAELQQLTQRLVAAVKELRRGGVMHPHEAPAPALGGTGSPQRGRILSPPAATVPKPAASYPDDLEQLRSSLLAFSAPLSTASPSAQPSARLDSSAISAATSSSLAPGVFFPSALASSGTGGRVAGVRRGKGVQQVE